MTVSRGTSRIGCLGATLLLSACYVTQKDWEARLDSDGDGYAADVFGQCDCDDEDAAVHPGAVETHDGRDENCDGIVDNSVYVSLALGAWHTCALNDWGGVRCWGSDQYGQKFDRTDPNTFDALSAGDFHTCGITESTVDCWGIEDPENRNEPDSNDKGQSADPIGTFRAVASGRYHNCAVTQAGDVKCWGIAVPGSSNHGQVEDAPLAGEGTVYVGISAGVDHSCAIEQGGTVLCWGNLASPPADDTDAAPTFSQIESGEAVACGVQTDGSLFCWGDDPYGVASGAPEGTFAYVAVGDTHACALAEDGTLSCWGDDGARDAIEITPDTDGDSDSDGDTDTIVIPAIPADGRVSAAPTGNGYVAVGAGAAHSCAVDASGAAVCWGSNIKGQGNPVKVAPKEEVTYAGCEAVTQ